MTNLEDVCERSKLAVFAGDGNTHRVILTRRWAPGPIMVTCGLNPSTADGLTDDPTIRKDIGFASRLSCGAIAKVNLHTFRSTNPKGLRAVPAVERTHPEGHEWMQIAINYCRRFDEPFWMTWGANARNDPRVDELLTLLSTSEVRVRALARLSDGTPAHTLMLPYSAVGKL